MVADITQVALPENYYDLWHDRAVFHFLTDSKDRELYLQNLKKSLKPNGHFIISTFAEDGPLKCSGLEIEKYTLEKMQQTFGSDFELVKSLREQHKTPFNTTQSFLYAHFRLKKLLE